MMAFFMFSPMIIQRTDKDNGKNRELTTSFGTVAHWGMIPHKDSVKSRGMNKFGLSVLKTSDFSQ
jgi:hypothetical protein